ncbi:MAG: RHS repeat domain-containing protein [Hyphomicrobium sp.]|jgi:YD repeat-containing protein
MVLVTRRHLLGSATSLAFSAVLFRSTAARADIQYKYDALGRLVEARFPDGTVVSYRYDAAGNRTELDASGGPPPAPPPFIATIAVAGAAPVDLRTLADQAGYTDARDAEIIFSIVSATTIIGAANSTGGGIAVDTGAWPISTRSISLELVVAGKLYGGGGAGGMGATTKPGTSGAPGGDAVFCRAPLRITVAPGGEIKAGGGGGGGGGAYRTSGTLVRGANGSGGGGGFPNGLRGTANVYGGLYGYGAPGTTTGGGAGGVGFDGGGAGGRGGNAGEAGAGGLAASGAGTRYAPGPGGAAGYAIRKNGFSVVVQNNGTISGTQG